MNFFVAVCGWGAGLFLSPRYPAFSEGIGMVYVHTPALHTHAHCCVVEEGHVLNLVHVLAELMCSCVHVVVYWG